MYHSFQLKQKLKDKQPLIGMLQTLDSPEVTEILAAAGFDWIFADLEHSILDARAAQRILQAAAGECPCVFRAPCHDEAWIKKLMDAGCAGILFPRVNTAAEARRIVDLCKYPPLGRRSVGLSRAHRYGIHFQQYVDNANDDIALVIQIEDIEAVNNIDEIVNVPGIDALFIGPYDLSGSMGKPGQVRDPEVMEKIELARKKGLDAGLAVGIFTVNPDDVKGFIQKGYTLIAVDIDTSLLAKTVQKTLGVIKG